MMEVESKLIKQGAEARVFQTIFCGKKAIAKERFKKPYRLPCLDEKLTHRRVVKEARCMAKCSKAGINTPTLYLIDNVNHVIYMEFIEGITVKEFLRKNQDDEKNKGIVEDLMKEIGKMLAKMHSIDIIHGDLTTSNLILRDDNAVVLIDFGLGYTSHLIEDKAVDLYVLERAFISTHHNSEELFSFVLKEYLKNTGSMGEQVNKKFEEVRLRGRKRSMAG
ncbi:TP53-regulating kinase-like protein [Anaeromyces robustus]|uniref:non-specific serine/threonine protein kinase n=1 Tax=Anaeromyces robustus TaxID=1754192 RepID=A0A1Y1WU34_9FUNG|nr:TP53-regulating kinase-like protein [Anaeromyces robustus]|eukprot:ORX77050.1 TP53-regulating kinase-like protein [Anaeromyces robustus]